MANDYRHTILLPRTDFPMKANLPAREPEIEKLWEEENLYGHLREISKDKEKFILHDGPPYANGDIHIGHAMNKILKDFIVRSRQMLGFNAPYVPGWDCHGLPIEWKIEEKYRKKKLDKDEVPPQEFRQECRDFAAHWIEVQKVEFKRLGITGDWDNPYTTMAFEAEAIIVSELLKFAESGSLYRGSKPVMWSPVEKTALAEAEVEYHDHTSTTIYVGFPIVKTAHKGLQNAKAVIWTTTPWTIPGNRAISYNSGLDYNLLEVISAEDESLVEKGDLFLVAEGLAEEFIKDIGAKCQVKEVIPGKALAGTVCHHPWHGQGYDFEIPFLDGDHVTLEQGTGLVHTAPGHGADDYEIWTKSGHADIPFTVDGDGRFYDHVPLVAGEHVYKVADHVVELLKGAGALLHTDKLVHSYPHSWRSKAPLIFRNTPQWFISMEKNNLREKSLKAIEDVRWVPERSKNRIKAMVESKPDWVISRQRAWGVPITVFSDKKTGEVLVDEAVNKRIVEAVQKEGADAWFLTDAQDFLGPDHKADDFEKCSDILDVWFDSGSTHAFVTEAREDLGQKADVYVEGSDQHRGWFQSSLIESCGTRGVAPYKEVLTHGFFLDSEGRKMSKSEGTGLSPQKIVDQYGADILRLWVASTDYFNDVRIGQQILQGQVDSYRKIRNTFRFLLGNLNGFSDDEVLPTSEMPELERWVLNRLYEMDQGIRQNINDYDFNSMYQALYNFCILDLSQFYFDIRKDSLYCDDKNSNRRRAARTVLNYVFEALNVWFAPILAFTTEEVWRMRMGDQAGSVHAQIFPDIPNDWKNENLAAKWKAIRQVRRVVTGALEIDRRDKVIGSSLAGTATIYIEDETFKSAIKGADFAEISITSGAEVVFEKAPGDAFRLDEVKGVAVKTTKALGEKCQRCWMILDEVGKGKTHDDLCNRCSNVVATLPAAPEES